MNAGKVAENAVGILVPLGMFWAVERGWFRFLGGRSEAWDPEAPKENPGGGGEGASPPLRSPFLESGTSRILSE
ncbi:MAG: Hypothetical protein C75L2_00240005 [Leptospirillum sp. Group II 'C75']|uniref:Uncharacterized protein n=1 Tax=Leptospirillum sp. Group II '5-way CG' TaxID=419541 RepID=B6AKU1_9BACT|nr:hypothetical protein [Leptospirillum sp. Group II 'CF-1']AKS24310.1 hypothetical protein ABH19_11955 [Leptospirillum sp. Group II 'CF-1']EAY56633.1 MAG: hypothetical protein UBAL2_80620277 [Leptospirillum rubarum]EDZ40195.1 MAG: Hypothetical protein CGL2_11364057 [Leptospirillum sp. Group II '5-way CG']EIJ77262.1 MAG: Hypothetical protein C75L2_00240005 [Leptospirillum sp. Group II 'C75']